VTSGRYALEFAPKALRALRKLDRPVVERIKAATESLRDDPRPAGAKMLTGMHGVLRIKVAGDYRVLYTIDDDRLVVLVVDAGHRRQILSLGLRVAVAGHVRGVSAIARGGPVDWRDSLYVKRCLYGAGSDRPAPGRACAETVMALVFVFIVRVDAPAGPPC
jgi:mRNA interferase RelE/StbE